MIPTRARAYDTKPAPSGTISGRNLPTVGAVTKRTAPGVLATRPGASTPADLSRRSD